MSDALSSPRGTIEHAKEHVAELKSLVGAFLETHPYETFVENDPLKPGYRILYLRFAKPIPRRIRGLAGDAANNFRAALDQIGYAVARASGKGGGDAHFPFGDDAKAKYQSGRGRCLDIPTPIFDLMLSFKPYKGGNETLWRLNKLANTMKHEISLEGTIIASNLSVQGPGFQLNVGQVNSAENKIALSWIIPGQDYSKHNFSVSPTIRFSDIDDATFDISAVTFLNECSRVVEGILVRVEREAKRIGIL